MLSFSRRARAIPAQNRLIAGLPTLERRRFLNACSPMHWRQDETICEAGDAAIQACFPVTGRAALLAPSTDGVEVGVAVLGDEGMLGAQLVLGEFAHPLKCVALVKTRVEQVDTAALRDLLPRNPALQSLMARYWYFMHISIARQAVCQHRHSVSQRLARWLLMLIPSASPMQIKITHATLGALLGVRRVSVTSVISKWQAIGLIDATRGAIAVVDRHALNTAACFCFKCDHAAYARVVCSLPNRR